MSNLFSLCCIGEIQLILNGTIITSNGFVNADDIGERYSALLCQTNKTDCCRYNQRGEWYFPNGSRVELARFYPQYDLYYRNRGDQVVRLNRRGNPSERGRFFCILPDANDIDQTVFVNIGKLSN